MQVKKRYFALPAIVALALPLAGCLSASNGLDYSRPTPPEPQTASPPGTPGPAGVTGGPMTGPVIAFKPYGPIPGEPYGGGRPLPVEAPPPPPPPPPPPAAPPCEMPAPGQKMSMAGCKQNDVLILRGVNFDFNKATLTPDAKMILDQVAEALTARPDIKVEVDGHTDGKGSVRYNQRLSEHRAATVKTYLIGKGIDGGRMTTAGFGKSRPIADNATEEGRAINRRVELKVTDAASDYAPVSVAPSAAPAAAPGGPAVTIAQFAFEPATITVPVGSTVTWTNTDADTPHLVKFPDTASGMLNKGASYSRTFSAAGEYTYQCSVHPYMTGKVIVQ
jgi:OOP family OmpA-OmpF porin